MSNTASGFAATVPGGSLDTAAGAFSFAAGRRAKANHDGAFVFADSNDFDFPSTEADQFRVRATGGAQFVLEIDGSGNPTWTCSVKAGTSWSCSGDRNLRENMTPVDGRDILARLIGLPIYNWNAKGTDPSIRHLGPTAQVFYAAFGLGDSDKAIATVDADGVALAAIQGLYGLVKEQDARIAELEKRGAALEEQNAAQQAQIDALEARLAALERRGGVASAPAGTLPIPGLALGGLALVGAVAYGRQKGGGR